jgi:hypothetical protein
MGGLMHRLEKLPVIRRYRQTEKDIAALEVPLELGEPRPLLRFCDLSESSKLPRPTCSQVVCAQAGASTTSGARIGRNARVRRVATSPL